jgi:hypothetical protein
MGDIATGKDNYKKFDSAVLYRLPLPNANGPIFNSYYAKDNVW